MNNDPHKRLGFLVKDVARLYSWHFDRLARQRLGLSLAQCRLLAAIARHEGDNPPSQAELAAKLDLTAMGIARLCDRMEAAKWLVRKASPTDRRTKHIVLLPRARKAFEEALELGNQLQSVALKGVGAADKRIFMDALRRVHGNLSGASSKLP